MGNEAVGKVIVYGSDHKVCAQYDVLAAYRMGVIRFLDCRPCLQNNGSAVYPLVDNMNRHPNELGFTVDDGEHVRGATAVVRRESGVQVYNPRRERTDKGGRIIDVLWTAMTLGFRDTMNLTVS